MVTKEVGQIVCEPCCVTSQPPHESVHVGIQLPVHHLLTLPHVLSL